MSHRWQQLSSVHGVGQVVAESGVLGLAHEESDREDWHMGITDIQ